MPLLPAAPGSAEEEAEDGDEDGDEDEDPGTASSRRTMAAAWRRSTASHVFFTSRPLKPWETFARVSI